MLTPGQVALGRIKADIRFQYRAWRMAVDWTVALYIVIPALAAAVYQYVTWWREPSYWLAPVPYGAVRSGLFLFAAAGSVRYYVEEADQLFLVQRMDWFRRVRGWGAGCSLARHGLWTIAAGLLLYPLLSRVYGQSPWDSALLMLTVYLSKIYIMAGKQQLTLRYQGWRGLLARALLLPAAGLMFGLLSGLPERNAFVSAAVLVMLALPIGWMFSARLRQKGTFYHDVRREQEEKMRIAGMLLSAGGISAPKKPRLRRKRPLLFPSSGKLYRTRNTENVLAESLIKAVCRNTSKLSLLGYAAAAYAAAVAVCPPGVLRWVVWLSVSALSVWMSAAFAREAVSEPYVRLFHWEDGIRLDACRKAGAGVSLPVCLLLALLTGFLELGALQALLMLPAGAAVSWAGARLFGMWSLKNP